MRQIAELALIFSGLLIGRAENGERARTRFPVRCWIRSVFRCLRADTSRILDRKLTNNLAFSYRQCVTMRSIEVRISKDTAMILLPGRRRTSRGHFSMNPEISMATVVSLEMIMMPYGFLLPEGSENCGA